MRTTLNIDDDLLDAARERARRLGKPLEWVISDLVRRALSSDSQAGEVAESGEFYGFEPLPRRGPMVSNELINALREDEGLVRGSSSSTAKDEFERLLMQQDEVLGEIGEFRAADRLDRTRLYNRAVR